MAKSDAKRVQSFADGLLVAIEPFDKLRCPSCSQRTLAIEYQRGSGLRIVCEGFAPHTEPGECEFTAFSLYTEPDDLPALTTTPDGPK